MFLRAITNDTLTAFTTFAVTIAETNITIDFILRVPIQDLVRHPPQELLILDFARAVVISVRASFRDLHILQLEAKGTHGNSQLANCDGSPV